MRGRSRWSPRNWISNTLGTINPVEKLTAWAHEQGAIMVVDAAQAVPHRAVDVQALGCDFLGFTSHKLCGPGGAGALWGRRELLESMPPFEMGGEMIRSVSIEKTTWNELPYKFEAGTPAIVEAYGMGIAIDYITEVGLEAIEEHEHELTVYAHGASGRAALRDGLRAATRATRRASSRSTSRACTRTTSPRSSTGKVSPSAPVITARSRS